MKASDNEIINMLGGTSAVAKECRVSLAAVSQWRIKGIPTSRLMYLQVKYPHLFRQLNTFKGQDHGEII